MWCPGLGCSKRPITTDADNPMNQSELEANMLASTKCREKYACMQVMIGCKDGARFFSQSLSVAMQNQSNHKITFGTQSKTALRGQLNN